MPVPRVGDVRVAPAADSASNTRPKAAAVAEKTNSKGVMRAFQVTQASIPSIAPHPAVTAQQLRKLGSGFLGAAEGGSFVLGNKDSPVTKAAKVVTATTPLVLTGLAVARNATVRMAAVASGLPKYHLATVDPAIKAGMAAAVQPVGFAFGSFATMVALKRFYDIAYDTAVDVAKDKSRQEMQQLLKDYDPVCKSFVDPVTKVPYEDTEKMARLETLAKEKNTWNGSSAAGSLWRTRGQRALDSLAGARDATTVLGFGVNSLVGSAATVGSLAAVAASGMAVATHSVFAAVSFAKAGVQTSAIANMEHARRLAKSKVQAYQLSPGTVKLSEVASTNRLLAACANRMIQERTYIARSQFLTGISYAFSAVLNGLSYAGIVGGGPLIAGIVSTLIYSVTAIGGTAFERWHATVMGRRREAAKARVTETLGNYKAMDHEERINFLRSIDKQSEVGTLELILLDTLRNGSPSERREIYAFFQACGISDNTIKSFIAEPSAEKALSAMQTQMYSARTHFMPKNMKYVPEAMGYITGLTYASRAIRGEADPALSDKQMHKLLREDPDLLPSLAAEGNTSLRSISPTYNGEFIQEYSLEFKDPVDEVFKKRRQEFRKQYLPPIPIASTPIAVN